MAQDWRVYAVVYFCSAGSGRSDDLFYWPLDMELADMKTIIEMAREAGGGLSCIAEPLEHPWKFSQAELERFAALVRADDREAFANKWEALHGYDKHGVAAAIRARGEA